ncbi:hypothetical protein GCK32_005526, partial [Trichostrongylus colubriformis]
TTSKYRKVSDVFTSSSRHDATQFVKVNITSTEYKIEMVGKSKEGSPFPQQASELNCPRIVPSPI